MRRNHLVTALLGLFMLMMFMPAVAQKAEKQVHEVISPKKFQKKLHKKNVVILDVRTPEEVAEGKVPGAENIDYLKDGFENKVEGLDKSKTYLVYCRSGKRSAKASAAMAKLGFNSIYELEGGFNAWKEQGYNIEK